MAFLNFFATAFFGRLFHPGCVAAVVFAVVARITAIPCLYLFLSFFDVQCEFFVLPPGKKSWFVEVISEIKFVALVTRLASSPCVVDLLRFSAWLLSVPWDLLTRLLGIQ